MAWLLRGNVVEVGETTVTLNVGQIAGARNGMHFAVLPGETSSDLRSQETGIRSLLVLVHVDQESSTGILSAVEYTDTISRKVKNSAIIGSVLGTLFAPGLGTILGAAIGAAGTQVASSIYSSIGGQDLQGSLEIGDRIRVGDVVVQVPEG